MVYLVILHVIKVTYSSRLCYAYYYIIQINHRRQFGKGSFQVTFEQSHISALVCWESINLGRYGS